jgi:hypothetical protein
MDAVASSGCRAERRNEARGRPERTNCSISHHSGTKRMPASTNRPSAGLTTPPSRRKGTILSPPSSREGGPGSRVRGARELELDSRELPTTKARNRPRSDEFYPKTAFAAHTLSADSWGQARLDSCRVKGPAPGRATGRERLRPAPGSWPEGVTRPWSKYSKSGRLVKTRGAPKPQRAPRRGCPTS